MKILDSVWGYMIGESAIKRLMEQYPDTYMIITTKSIGDQCQALAYAGEFKKLNNIDRIAYITLSNKNALLKYFKNEFDFSIEIGYRLYHAILAFLKSDRGYDFQLKYPTIICAYYTAHVRNNVFFKNPYIRLSNIIKALYHIPLNTYPCDITKSDNVEWINSLIEKGTIVRNKTVLMNPYAKSIIQTPIRFFEKSADYFRSKGYKVITSVVGEQKAIEGTEGIKFPLDNAIELADECGYVYGARSGFMDLVSFSKAKIIAIDNTLYPYCDACLMEDWWPQNTNIKTFRYQEKDDSVWQMLCEYIESEWEVKKEQTNESQNKS